MSDSKEDVQGVVIVGASGFGRESLDVLEAMISNGSKIKVLGVIDDFPSEINLKRLEEREISYLGTIESFLTSNKADAAFVLGIGSPDIRIKLATRLESAGLNAFTALHPSVLIGARTVISPGVVICAGSVISTNVHLGKYVHINPQVTIGHDSLLHDFCSVNPAAIISGEVEIGTGVLVGAGATILQQLTIANDVVVGAGSVVTKSVPESVIVKGIPGRWDD